MHLICVFKLFRISLIFLNTGSIFPALVFFKIQDAILNFCKFKKIILLGIWTHSQSTLANLNRKIKFNGSPKVIFSIVIFLCLFEVVFVIESAKGLCICSLFPYPLLLSSYHHHHHKRRGVKVFWNGFKILASRHTNVKVGGGGGFV